ncbi:MAG TPA: malectin domain-containing carbohydrate-binding protein [Terriglobia bacterium]|nr:malectin domain-containing carbohydrate-binding protein [Terriglobia bacterium]
MAASGINQLERDELESILHSGIFSKAPRQAKLLEHICNEYFSGRASQIKEYNLAIEALGKSADFDQNRDAIVRVEIHRLRTKLREYYEGRGQGRPLRIVIDPGQYVPRFVPREETPSLRPDASAETPEILEIPNFERPRRVREGAALSPKLGGSRAIVVLLGGLALLALAVTLVSRLGKQEQSLKASSASQPGAAGPSLGTGALDSVRILCGYLKDKYIDRAGNTWSGDRYFSGGTALSQPPQFIARAPDLSLYQTFRSGQFSYDIPLKPGHYEVHLYFVETHYGPGTLSGGGETSRLFNVSANGKPLLKIFDIIKDAGGNNVGDIRVFKDVSPAADGYLHLKFDSLIDSPILNALEIEPAPPGKINPIRILAQNNSYTDHSGNIWSPDRYYEGGQQATHATIPVRGTEDPILFMGERFGYFSYAISLAPGKYRLALRFAETYWGVVNRVSSLPDQNGSLEGGTGSRVFNVYANGVALLRNFDIAKEAGAPLIAVEKTFHNLEPDAQGKLVLSFVPVKDYACVTALEVVAE